MRAILFLFTALLLSASPADAGALRIVALGDSLTAGYGLQSGEDYATRLQEELIRRGHDVRVDNAGVSGDTTAGGLSRVAWSVDGDPKPSLVIVALGGNDMLRAIDPKVTEENLRQILQKLKDREIPAVLYGMKAPTNLPNSYRKPFDQLYPKLADEFGVPLYAFFLDGVAMDPKLNQQDGIHPTAEAVRQIAAKTAKIVEKSLPDN